MRFKSLTYISFLLIAITVGTPCTFAQHKVTLHKDVIWATPKGFPLTADIYVPDNNAQNMPTLIIYHGGGWLLNTKEIMSDLAHYIAANANIVVVNSNYRTLASLDNTTTANEIVEDAMGAVLWVKDNIQQYNGDPKQIAVTGDSAGGHLAAMVTLAGRQLESDGFAGNTLGFTPSYLPANKTAEQIADEDGVKVQAAILNYAAFDLYASAKNGFESASNPFWKWTNAAPRGLFGAKINVEDNANYYQATSPNHYIVTHNTYAFPPQFVLVGSNDTLTTPQSAQHYVDTLKKAGQPVTFKIINDRTHGFLDSGCPAYSSGCFSELAFPAVTDMIHFLNETFAQAQN